jgi:hypothetical protein
MTRVRVAILHRAASPTDGPLTHALIDARARLAHRHARTFRVAGAAEAAVHAGPRDGRTFGARLRALVADLGQDDGLVVLGSGAVPRHTPRLARWFVAVAASPRSKAAANDRYSADIVSVARAREALETVPDLATDNALPRWLTESAGIAVGVPAPADRARLAMDLDSPLDLLLLGGAAARALPPAVVGPLPDPHDAIGGHPGSDARAPRRRADVGSEPPAAGASDRDADPRPRRGARSADGSGRAAGPRLRARDAARS